MNLFLLRLRFVDGCDVLCGVVWCGWGRESVSVGPARSHSMLPSQGAFATSIARLADGLGLPRWLVDIRHEATHGEGGGGGGVEIDGQ
jgi:hypothetical protein